MDALWIMFRNVIVFVALALPGFILVKSKTLKQEQSGALSKLLMYVGMPFLVLSSIINNITFDTDLLFILAMAVVIGFVYTLAMFFVSKPLTFMEQNEKTRGMMRFSTVFTNNGFLGIPLALAVFGAGSMVLMVVIVINIITNILMYTLGVSLISGDKKTIKWKNVLLNPVLIAFIVGIILNLLKIKEYVPEVATYSTHFSNLVTPISMMILGVKMGTIKASDIFKSWKTYYVSVVKLILCPITIVAVLFIANMFCANELFNIDIIVGVFIAFALPTAGLASTFSDNYNGDTKNAVAFTLGSTILSIMSIPILYWLLCLVLGV